MELSLDNGPKASYRVRNGEDVSLTRRSGETFLVTAKLEEGPVARVIVRVRQRKKLWLWEYTEEVASRSLPLEKPLGPKPQDLGPIRLWSLSQPGRANS